MDSMLGCPKTCLPIQIPDAPESSASRTIVNISLLSPVEGPPATKRGMGTDFVT